MSDKRYMGFTSIFILIILVLSMAFLIPSIYLSLDATDSENFQQSNNSEITVRGDLSSIVTDINQSKNTIDITLTLESDTVFVDNIAEGETREVTISGHNISVSVGLIISNNTVSTNYEYPQYMEWPDGAQYIVENSVLILVVLAFTLVVGLMLMSFKIQMEN